MSGESLKISSLSYEHACGGAKQTRTLVLGSVGTTAGSWVRHCLQPWFIMKQVGHVLEQEELKRSPFKYIRIGIGLM